MTTKSEKIQRVMTGEAASNPYDPITSLFIEVHAELSLHYFTVDYPRLIAMLVDGTNIISNPMIDVDGTYIADSTNLLSFNITKDGTTWMYGTADTTTYTDASNNDVTAVLEYIDVNVDGVPNAFRLYSSNYFSAESTLLTSISLFDSTKAGIAYFATIIPQEMNEWYDTHWGGPPPNYKTRPVILKSATDIKKKVLADDGLPPEEEDATFLYQGAITLAAPSFELHVSDVTSAIAYLVEIGFGPAWDAAYVNAQTVLTNKALEKLKVMEERFTNQTALEVSAYILANEYLTALGFVNHVANNQTPDYVSVVSKMTNGIT